MKYRNILLTILIMAGILAGQNVDRFGRQRETALEFSTMEQKKDLLKQSKEMNLQTPENLMMLPIEKAVNPNEYIVGPGDQFGININTLENLNFVAYVGPAGDILIPTVGVVNVNKLSLSEAVKTIQQFVLEEGYKTADVYVALINVRQFKIQIAGAVNNPGFYIANPLTRMSEIVEMAMGFHSFAREFATEIHKNGEQIKTIDYLDYILTGNLDNNPNFSEGCKIFVPFGV